MLDFFFYYNNIARFILFLKKSKIKYEFSNILELKEISVYFNIKNILDLNNLALSNYFFFLSIFLEKYLIF